MEFTKNNDPWTLIEENKLKELYNNGYDINKLSNIFCRTRLGIRSKLKRCNILKTNKRFSRKSIVEWSRDKLNQLVKLYSAKIFTIKEIAIICEKSVQEIKYKLSQLKLLSNKKILALRSYKNWSKKETDMLIKLVYEYGCSKQYIAKILCRTPNAIDMKLKKIKIHKIRMQQEKELHL